MLVASWRNAELPPKLPMKVFKKEHQNIPEIDNYEEAQGDEYWQHWVKRGYRELTPARSWICPNRLYELARDLDYNDWDGRLGRTMTRLQNGADIGCEGDSKLPTNKPNSDRANEYGVRVADSLHSWI